ncbi:hypothetical protein NY049_11335 [Corynebacterium diphtheriae bv. gravis]|nr:hypothetical protein NY049_11335 [Corynebacterium diphtheriae bv. gravis]
MTDTTLTAAATIALLTAAPMTASAADTKDNEVSGLVVPFNEMGDTSAGRFAVARDAIALPDDLGGGQAIPRPQQRRRFAGGLRHPRGN